MLILTDRQNYSDIADAIREASGSEEEYLPSEMPDAIRGLTEAVRPALFDADNGYVSGGTFYYDNHSDSYSSDVYALVAGHMYLVGLGKAKGNRSRVMLTTSAFDPERTSGSISGTGVYGSDVSAETATVGMAVYAPSDSTLIVYKSNGGHKGVPSFVFDLA